MQPFGVASGRLDGVPEGVAEVQQRAVAGLALVATHHLGLEFAGTMDGMGQRFVGRAPAAHPRSPRSSPGTRRRK